MAAGDSQLIRRKTSKASRKIRTPFSRSTRQVLALRHKNEQLIEGSYVSHHRRSQCDRVSSALQRQAVLVVLNMSGSQQKINLDLAKQGFGADAKTLVTSMKNVPCASRALRR